MLLAMCLILSLALPLDRAKPCFIITTVVFGLLSILTIVGMVFYLYAAGFYPHEMIRQDYVWTKTENRYLSWLVVAGVIMLSIYVVPMILRPIDFLNNFKGYIVGLLAYLLLIPMFSNIFSIYSMCNLHDISWGNRPTTDTGGTEAFSSSSKIQKETEMNYKAYRANFLFLWFCANGAYFVAMLQIAESGDDNIVNTNDFSVLDGFSLYLAGVVVFRFFFGFLYVLKW